MSDKLIASRIAEILQLQSSLEKSVSGMQMQLVRLILERIKEIYNDPSVLDVVFRKFVREQFYQVVHTFGSDLLTIAASNDLYFAPMVDEVGSTAFAAIKSEVRASMLERFGLTKQGNLVENGYLDSFLKDPSIKRQVKDYAYKSMSADVGVERFTAGMSKLIAGDTGRSGLYERYFSQYSFDAYQSADRTNQLLFANRLKLTAFFYSGGLVADSRPFCQSKNGKVFLISEAEQWRHQTWNGKSEPYDPLINLGGYGCRHSCAFLSNELAISKRPDLVINEKGVLEIKQVA